jgi:hypothetical protein
MKAQPKREEKKGKERQNGITNPKCSPTKLNK